MATYHNDDLFESNSQGELPLSPAVEVRSSFQNKPCYRYIRASDHLPAIGQGPAPTMCRVKLFNPCRAGTWWIAEYDPFTGQCYGVAEIQEREAGYFNIRELLAYRGPLGLPIERDLHFDPVKLTTLIGLDDSSPEVA